MSGIKYYKKDSKRNKTFPLDKENAKTVNKKTTYKNK